jgi:DNA-binding beta-propeller fold protein YncE
MKSLFRTLALIVLISTALSSCKKDDDPQGQSQDIPASSGRVLISCEGSFLGVNASISAYNPENKLLVNDVFQTANGQALGDVLQSLNIRNGKVYAMVNNSGKVSVMEKEGLVAESPITGFSSPRFMLPISNQKAYVSDLFSGGVAVVDLATKVITAQINLNSWTEEMLLDGDFAYVTSADKDKVYVINVNTDMLVDSVQVTMGPVSLAKDAQNKLWVLCSGYFGAADPKLHRIDLSTSTVMATMNIPSPFAYQMRMAISPDKMRIYVMNNTVYAMNIDATALLPIPVVPFTGNAYGLGISPLNGDVYVADVADFTNPGKVFRYSSSGVVLDSMVVGIAPNGFLFQ